MWKWYTPPVGRQRAPRLTRWYLTEESAARMLPPGSYKSSWTETRDLPETLEESKLHSIECGAPGGAHVWTNGVPVKVRDAN